MLLYCLLVVSHFDVFFPMNSLSTTPSSHCTFLSVRGFFRRSTSDWGRGGAGRRRGDNGYAKKGTTMEHIYFNTLPTCAHVHTTTTLNPTKRSNLPNRNTQSLVQYSNESLTLPIRQCQSPTIRHYGAPLTEASTLTSCVPSSCSVAVTVLVFVSCWRVIPCPVTPVYTYTTAFSHSNVEIVRRPEGLR